MFSVSVHLGLEMQAQRGKAIRPRPHSWKLEAVSWDLCPRSVWLLSSAAHSQHLQPVHLTGEKTEPTEGADHGRPLWAALHGF